MFNFHHIYIGSYALGLYPHNDIDVVCMEKDLPNGIKSSDGYIAVGMIDNIKYEFLLADKTIFLKDLLSKYKSGQKVSNADLLILKAGHLHVPSRKWQKHMNDYILLKALCNYPIRGYRKKVEKHIADTNTRHNIHQMKLKGVTKDEFFDDAVVKYYDHDYLHEQLAIDGVPAYTLMQKQDGSVMCHKDLWDGLTQQQRLNCATEESMVIGLERFIIPSLEKSQSVMPNHMAFRKGVEKLCTTLSSGWFRTFCHNHYTEIVNNFNEQLINNFKTKHYE